MTPATSTDSPEPISLNDKLLFWACFTSIMATAFGFIIRTQVMADWVLEYSLDATQVGKINGMGLWPFAITMVLFSLLVDRIGYGVAMGFAFACHAVATILVLLTPYLVRSSGNAFALLSFCTFLMALGDGTVEAVSNPVVADLFPRQKTRFLNLLHAGWSCGLVVGGTLAIVMGSVNWRYKFALNLIPVFGYAALMLGRRFPRSERVAAGVSYTSMLQEAGIIGAALTLGLLVREIGTSLSLSMLNQCLVWLALVAAYAIRVKGALGQPLFLFFALIMIPVATTQMGTDGIMTLLMTPEMNRLGLAAGWVLVYASLVMLSLRVASGPIVRWLKPLGLLCVSSLALWLGLIFLSNARGGWVLVAATLYGFGNAYCWPTMLGVVAEQFPRGGALTLNLVAAVGVLAAGVLGAPLQGYIQDTRADAELLRLDPGLHSRVISEPRSSAFGSYRSLDGEKIRALPQADRERVEAIDEQAKRHVLKVTAILPAIMLACYLGLGAYYRSKGGYVSKIIVSPVEESEMMTGGTEAPADR